MSEQISGVKKIMKLRCVEEKARKARVSGIQYLAGWNMGKGVLVYTWRGCVDDYRFPLVKSKEYIDFCEKYRVEEIDARFCRFDDDPDTDGVVLIYPDIKEIFGFSFFFAKEKRERVFVVLYNGKRINADPSKIDYYYKDGYVSLDKPVGLWNGGLVYVGADCVYLLMQDGRIANIAPYPDMSESGQVSIRINGDTLTVKEYVYYDVDRKHGGWEICEYDIRKKKKKKLGFSVYN